MVKQENKILSAGLILTLLAALIIAVPPVTGKSEADPHPELTEQEMLMDCAECHKEATPEVEKEWFDSVHGIAMVKCYQCHGTFETFRLTPTKQDCATCHTNMLDKCPQEKPCWECHVPHSFKNKK
ncbi:cytochrome c3 family protein [Desulfopila sp. IMCC35008]|uniref:cytochrome c3 family protein n=1 Tax=Desulfopila sp. IMCC35008 TaxID=2653858 RepID=UPI0013D6BDED|nr:cytochrome c3 family protein [Desulfopila sp. IMCC35008]